MKDNLIVVLQKSISLHPPQDKGQTEKNLKDFAFIFLCDFLCSALKSSLFSVLNSVAKLTLRILVINSKNWSNSHSLAFNCSKPCRACFLFALKGRTFFLSVEDNENASFMILSSLEAMNHGWSQICLLSALYLNNDIRNNFLWNQL